MGTEGSRLFAFTLLPFLSNPQKIHVGTCPTKTSIVLHGASKEGVQEQLHTSATFSTEAHVFYILSKTLDTEVLPESHAECMFFYILYILWVRDLSSRFPSLCIPQEILVFPV